MATYGTVLRRSAAVVEGARAHARSTRKALARFARPQSFAAPPDAEAAAVRVVRNLQSFRLYYGALLWVLLLASLFPRHRPTLVFLMVVPKIAVLYGVLLKACPNSTLLHRIIDRRLVIAVILLVVVVELVITRAVPQLLLALGFGLPVVLLHAVFRARDDLAPSGEEAAGEASKVGSAGAAAGDDLRPISEKKEEDLEKGSK